MPRTANPAAAYWLGFSADGRRARRCGCLGGCAVVLRAGLSALGCAGWCGAAGGPRPVRCFVLDLLAFTAAAVLLVGFSAGVSAAGLARWYMAVGLAAGALAWQKAIVPPLHALAAWIVRLLLAPARWGRRYIAVPLRKAACARLAALKKRCCPRRPREKAGKSKKSGKNQLQKKSKILYN